MRVRVFTALPGTIERQACWDMILANDDLASVMGSGDMANGKACVYFLCTEVVCVYVPLIDLVVAYWVNLFTFPSSKPRTDLTRFPANFK